MPRPLQEAMTAASASYRGPAGEPFVLEPWQRAFVDELYRTDERGNRNYKRGTLGVPRVSVAS